MLIILGVFGTCLADDKNRCVFEAWYDGFFRISLLGSRVRFPGASKFFFDFAVFEVIQQFKMILLVKVSDSLLHSIPTSQSDTGPRA